MIFRTVLLAASLAAPAALAEAPAAIWPTRDVTVTYDAPGPRGERAMQMAFAAKDRLARMDMGPQGYGIIDYKARRMTMVMPAQHMYMVVTAPDDMPIGTEITDHVFTRVGTRKVAGLACTDAEGRRGLCLSCAARGLGGNQHRRVSKWQAGPWRPRKRRALPIILVSVSVACAAASRRIKLGA